MVFFVSGGALGSPYKYATGSMGRTVRQSVNNAESNTIIQNHHPQCTERFHCGTKVEKLTSLIIFEVEFS